MRQVSVYPLLEHRRRLIRSPEGLFARLRALPFWCGDMELHKRLPDTYTRQGCCLTHTVGLPLHPATKRPSPPTPFQIELFEALTGRKARAPPGERREPHQAHKFMVIKARQMGFTEWVLRTIQFESLHHYAGSKVGIIAATNGSLARKDLRRLYMLFRNIRDVLADPVLKGTVLELADGTRIEAFPASEEAMTGDTQYKAIFMDEAAKWRVLDDTPIFNSIVPIVNTNAADLFLVSTPKGPVKMFYEIHQNPKDYEVLRYDIWAAEGSMYSRAQIERMIESAKEDPDQEYLCKFTLGRDAVFGEVLDSERSDEVVEWR